MNRLSRFLFAASFFASLAACQPVAGRSPVDFQFTPQDPLDARPATAAAVVIDDAERSALRSQGSYLGILHVHVGSYAPSSWRGRSDGQLPYNPELNDWVTAEAARNGATHVVLVSRVSNDAQYALYRVDPAR